MCRAHPPVGPLPGEASPACFPLCRQWKPHRAILCPCGPLAQMGERRLCTADGDDGPPLKTQETDRRSDRRAATPAATRTIHRQLRSPRSLGSLPAVAPGPAVADALPVQLSVVTASRLAACVLGVSGKSSGSAGAKLQSEPENAPPARAARSSTVDRGCLRSLHMPRSQAWCYGLAQKGAAAVKELCSLSNPSWAEPSRSISVTR